MLINTTISFTPDKNTGRSECSLLLEALFEYQHRLELDDAIYGDDTERVIWQLDAISRSINSLMLKALESLDTLHIQGSNGDIKTVFAERATSLKESELLTTQKIGLGRTTAI